VKLHVEISFFEIYNEKIHDLLASSSHSNHGNKDKKPKKTTVCGYSNQHVLLYSDATALML